MNFDDTDPLHRAGSLMLLRSVDPPDDLDPQLLLVRRTSRLPYDARTVTADVLGEAADEAARHGHVLRVTDDERLVREVVASQLADAVLRPREPRRTTGDPGVPPLLRARGPRQG